MDAQHGLQAKPPFLQTEPKDEIGLSERCIREKYSEWAGMEVKSPGMPTHFLPASDTGTDLLKEIRSGCSNQELALGVDCLQ
jgi:hypothetical protein